MIFSLFLLFSPLVVSSATTVITVCQGDCPSSAKGETISYYSADDLTSKLDDYMAAENEIYFFTYTDEFTFSFSINVFDGHHVELKKLDLSNHVNLGIDCSQGRSAGDITFIGIDVELASMFDISSIEIDALTLKNTNVDLHKVGTTLKVGYLETDDSIKTFKNVIINKSLTNPTGVTLDMTSSRETTIVLKDLGFSAKITSSTEYSFINTGYTTTNFKTDGGKLCSVSYQATSPSKIPSITFTNFENINFAGTWPEDAKVHVTDKFSLSKKAVSITAGGSVLPISYSGYNATIFLSQDSTVVSGDCSGMLKFGHVNNKFLTRTTVTLKGEYKGSEIDLGNGYVDLIVKRISGDFTYGDFPFVFRVGVGGASTVKVESCSAEETKKTGVKVYPDFYKYLSDSELKTLLGKEWNILTMTGMTFSISYIHIISQSDYFIHGFQDKDSCISVAQKSSTLILTASAPSLLPLNICFDGDEYGGDCGSDDGVEIRNIDQLTTYFEDGMKYLNLTIKLKSMNDLDFTAFDYGYSDVKVKVLGFGTSVEQISFAQGGAIVDISFDNLIIGKSDFYVKKVNFTKCKCQAYSEFSFHSNEVIIGDDSFIKLFVSHISTTYPIKNLTYVMDLYDAMDVKDKEFIFYDLDRNDISDPMHLPSDILEHLYILYDVGITATADRNNLNVTMSTSNPPSFDIKFSSITPGYWSEAELILYKWKQTQSSSFVVNFEHGILNVVVVLTEPYQPKQLKVTGTGNVRYVNRYSDDLILCATNDGTSTGCPEYSNPVTYSGLLSEFSSTQKNNITVYIARSTTSKHPSIELYLVDRKVVTFIGLASNAADIIEFTSQSTDGIDIKTSTTNFRNLNVLCGSGSTIFPFGELKFTDCIIDSSFKNAAIQVDDFYCEYKILSSFKSVFITDNCYVSGEYSTVASEVKFAEDDNAGDLQANLSYDAKLEIGDEYVKIGATTFKFSSVEPVYDVVLYVSPKKTVDVTKASGASENLMPIVRVSTCVDTTFNFLGQWKECDKTQIFLFNQVDELTIGLASENVPVSLSSDEGDFYIVAKAETVGISGMVEYRQIKKVNIVTVKYEIVSKAKITIAGQFNIGGGVIFKFSQPSIELVVSEIAGSKSDSAIIQAEHYSDLKGDSLLTIQKAMISSVLSQDYKVQIPISVAIDDPSFTAYFSKNHTFVKVFHGDTSRIKIGSLYLIGTSTMHGVSESNLGISVADKTGEVYMYFRQSPILVPFALCYETLYSCEIKVTDDALPKIDTLLPKGATNIIITFGKANTNDLVLSSDKIKGSRVQITQSGTNAFDVKLKLGSGYVNTLLLETVNAKITDNGFSVGSLEMKNSAQVSSVTGFNSINVDYTTWKAREFPSFQNELILNCTIQSLTFTANGWSIESKEYLQSKYPGLKFNFQTLSPILDVNSGVTSIRKTTITSKAKMVTIGANWNIVTSSSPIVDYVSDNIELVTVAAKSYPFTAIPKLMNAGKVQIDTSLLPYTISQPITFDNVKSVVDFTNVADASKAHINIKSISMEHVSTLAAKGVSSGYPISIEKVTAAKGAISNLTLCEVTNSIEAQYDAVLRGDFNTKDIDVVLKWKLGQIPNIEYESDPASIPKSVTFKFEEMSIKDLASQYESYLYHKTHNLVRLNQNKCTQWLQRAKFESTSTVKCFGSESVLEFTCSGNYLNVYGKDHVPGYSPDDDDDDDDDSGKKKLSGGAIAGIVIFVLALIAGGAGVAYYFLRKRNEYYMLNSERLESYGGQQAKFIDGNQI